MRRAFLCGIDTLTGISYEHRRQWIVDRMKRLADIFAMRTHQLSQDYRLTDETDSPSGLLPFAGYPHKDMPKGLPFRFEDYLELIDLSGRAILKNKRGYIPDNQPPILERLQIDPQHWLYMTRHFESRFKGLVGMSYSLKAACRRLGYRRTPNLGSVLQLLT